MKMLSRWRALPSVEILVLARFKRSVQSKDVNCDPWSVFMISGGLNLWMASFSTSTQNSASSVLEMRQASTLRVNQSMMATRWRKPLRIGKWVMSAHQT